MTVVTVHKTPELNVVHLRGPQGELTDRIARAIHKELTRKAQNRK
jgi:hypothetical protein